MMGAAESISDLRSLLSIVAEETGALKMNDADEDSVGWTTEGPLPMTFGHVRRAHAALAALEAALSAAEPVGELQSVDTKAFDEAIQLLPSVMRPSLSKVIVAAIEEQRQIIAYFKRTSHARQLAFEAVSRQQPAPSVALKALQELHATEHGKLGEMLLDKSEDGQSKANWQGGRVNGIGAAISALSAQVQDVARWQPIETADKDAHRLLLGVVRRDVLEEVHIGGFRYAINDDEVSCWWSDQCDDEIVPTHWMPLPAAPAKQEG